MPRKYHRPPAVKRRKSKKTAPYGFEGAPEPEDGEAAGLPGEGEPEDEDEEPVEQAPAMSADRPAAPDESRSAVRHIVADYSYVPGELMRIVAIATFLVISLVITSILR